MVVRRLGSVLGVRRLEGPSNVERPLDRIPPVRKQERGEEAGKEEGEERKKERKKERRKKKKDPPSISDNK
jgi:hypothetical protein